MLPTNRVIDKFRGDFSFLSNFYPCKILFELKHYPSVEHAFQAAKTLSMKDRERIRTAPTPGIAKRFGRKVKLRPNWDEIKLDIMYELLHKKFSMEPLRTMLLHTQHFTLIEGNNWGDTFWGICNGVGENHLGKLLMKIRSELSK